MKIRIGTLLAGACAVALAGYAAAQQTTPIGLSLRAGAFFPTDSSARSEANTWFAFGAEFKVKDLHFGEQQAGYSSSLSISADCMTKGSYQNVPVLVNYVGRVNQIYYTAGAGLSFTEVPNETSNSNDTLFGYSLGVGYDFQQAHLPVFIEARYFGTTESRLDGYVIYLGVRL
jgi:hypothetical protein